MKRKGREPQEVRSLHHSCRSKDFSEYQGRVKEEGKDQKAEPSETREVIYREVAREANVRTGDVRKGRFENRVRGNEARK